MKSSKKSIAEWKKVRDNLGWELSNNPSLELMRTILLLYYEIRRNRISRLWMAGVLETVCFKSRREMTLECLGHLKCTILYEILQFRYQKKKVFLLHAMEKMEKNKEEIIAAQSKVLDLEDAPIDELPIITPKIEKLPNEIVKLQDLRQLSASYLTKRELKYFLEEIWSIVVPQIFSLQVVSRLRVTSALLLQEMEQLTRNGMPSQLMLLHSPYLEKLTLDGKLGKVPHWFNTLLNLKFLSLQFTEVGEDAVSHLQALPNLLKLNLSNNAFVGKRLCLVEGFKKLQYLNLCQLPQQKEIVIETGVMPGLKDSTSSNARS
ncbi:disease resistance protein RPM1-like [Gossypium australe]|uniref:Disease resistance protein RPM1-like n=1 Tax=Gossypium australe TaxID=47621 RepID=A0A5B6UFA2_9ROSI|nr:disease resistance protein RPM1-like [Gossypium australe]